MRPSVTLIAAGAAGPSAVGSRIGAFAGGLAWRGWDVTVIDPAAPLATVADRILSRTPTALRSMLERVAGGPVLGSLLVQHLRLAPGRVISVSNGYDVADVQGLRAVPIRPERNGTPLDLVMSGYWYGRNGPGILLDTLKCVGPEIAELTVIGGVSPPIAAQLHGVTGHTLAPHIARSHRELYKRLHEADAAVVTMDSASAVESRIPAKVYDYLATGVPVIAVCPAGTALLQIPEAQRFHHVHHQDVTGFVVLLRRAMRDRTVLRAGMLGEGPTRERGVTTLQTLLHHLVRQPGR